MERKITVREQIIDNSKKLFKEHGFNATSMQMIADACEISKSLIKYYFPKKSDISAVIMKEHLDSIREYVKSMDKVKDDAALAYVLTMKYYYDDIYGNEAISRFNREALLISSGKEVVNNERNMDEIYREIVIQYNINITDKLFNIRKAQILGSQIFLIDASMSPESDITDKDRFEGAIYSTLVLLGVSAYHCNEILLKAEEIYNDNHNVKFSML